MFFQLVLVLLLAASAPRVSAAGPTIASLTVLLPPRMSNPVEYRLVGTDGCFSWTWDHHDFLTVQPEYNLTGRCSTSARLISIAPYSGRKETAVYATDIYTGIVIRCEVIIDKIFKIRIFHHSLKLDLDGLAPLQIRAFDEEENVFSSLVGLEFIWKLVPKSSHIEHHLVNVPLKNTPLSDCGGSCGDLNTQIKLEDRGVGSDLYVVRGIEIGQERVSACMFEPWCEHLKDEIVITVAEAMSLDPPSPVFVIIGTTINYELRIIRQNTPKVIQLPSPNHRWSTSNSSVIHVDSTTGSVYASDFGVTSVIVEDIRVSGNLQISTVHVIRPEKLCLHLVPVDSLLNPVDESVNSMTTSLWYVVIDRLYIIHVKALLHEPMQEIHLTKDNSVSLEYGRPHLWITSPLRDEAYVPHKWSFARLIEPFFQGLGTLEAELVYKHAGMLESIKIIQEVMVCDQIKLVFNKSFEKPPIMHLPWLPDIYQEVKLTASGGCAKSSKDYNWLSSDATIVSVLSTGLISARRPGRAIIKVVSVFDSLNYDELVIEVSVPSSLTIVPDFPVEAAVGTYLYAAVTMKTSNGSYFYKCDAFRSSVKWLVHSGRDSFRVVDTREESIVPPLLWSPCAWTHLYASRPGRATIYVALDKESISSENFSNKPNFHEKSFVVAAFVPVVVQQAGNGNQFGGYWIDVESRNAGMDELFLAPGSEMDLLVMGGPEPWDQGVDYVDKAEVVADNHLLQKGIIVSEVSNKVGKVYKVACQSEGNFRLIFSRGNLAGDGHLLPIILNVEVSLMCSFPSSITLVANEPENGPDVLQSFIGAERGLGRIRTSPLSVANGCTIRLSAVGIHSSGKPFANSSSLCLLWQLSDCEHLAKWTETTSLGRSECTWERFLILHNATGLCFVRAMVSGLTDSSSSQSSLSIKNSLKDLTDALTLQLVSSVKIIPQSLLLYFNPKAKENLSIVGGTCLLESKVNDTDIVNVTKSLGIGSCSDFVVFPKKMGVALLTVHDVGLLPSITSSAKVEVADVDWIKIVSQEVVYLMAGATKSFYLSAGVHDGRIFDPSQYMYMDIELYLENDVLERVAEDNTSMLEQMKIRGSNFFLRATEVGITTIHVIAKRHSGNEVSSQRIRVEVYTPLNIHPDVIFLVPGSSYALAVRGGLTSDVVLEYASMNDSAVTADSSSGRLFALNEGSTTISASVLGHGGEVISIAYAKVRVGIPSEMFISLQSEQLAVGRDMKTHVSSSEGDAFSFFELCKDYKWTIEDEQVLGFRRWQTMNYDAKPFKDAESNNLNYSYLETLDFMNIIFGRSAGKTNLSVSFSCNFQSLSYSRSVLYKSSTLLVVIADPPSEFPITWVLPPFYTTSEILPLQVDSYGEQDTKSRKGNVAYFILRTCGKGDLVGHDPIVINGARIQTKESKSFACIQVKDKLTGRTEVAGCTRVAEVDHVRVTSSEHLTHVVEVAVGDRIELLLNVYDALGIPFREAYGVISVEVDTNYHDIVSIERSKDKDAIYDIFGKVYLQAKRPGRALVRITPRSNLWKADYILISVGGHLYPQNPVLSVGDTINFTVSKQGPGDLLRWSSANKSVIVVDEHTGESYAIGEGSTDVFGEGLGLELRTKVTVLKMASVLVNSPVEILTNALFPSFGYNFSVTFSDSYSQKVDAGTGEIHFDCTLNPSFVGLVKPWMNRDTGKAYCRFFPYSPEHLVDAIRKLKLEKSELIGTFHGSFLHITIAASLREAPQVMGVARAVFVGGFSVVQENKTFQCNLVPYKNKCFISLIGNTDVSFQWNAKDQLLVKLLRRDDNGMGGRAEYEISVLNGKSFADKVVIFLLHAGQKVELDVTYDAGERLASVSGSVITVSGILWTTIAIAAAALVFFIMRKKGFARRAGAAAGSNTGLSTPLRSPGSYDRNSPGTPPSYLDYVRTTIHGTPYYKRNGRRRFDPQNTY